MIAILFVPAEPLTPFKRGRLVYTSNWKRTLKTEDPLETQVVHADFQQQGEHHAQGTGWQPRDHNGPNVKALDSPGSNEAALDRARKSLAKLHMVFTGFEPEESPESLRFFGPKCVPVNSAPATRLDRHAGSYRRPRRSRT
jgi:hypothetical protein